MSKTFLLKLDLIWQKIIFYGSEKVYSFYDLVLLSLGVKDTSLKVAHNTKTTILVSGNEPNFRVLKYVKWLHETGKYDFILSCHQASKLNGVDTRHFLKIAPYRNAIHLKRMVLSSNADRGIAFTAKPSYALPLIQNAGFPVLFDPYDCMVIYYGHEPSLSWMKKEVPLEGECFALAHGVIARNLECRAALDLFKIKSKGSILFSDYCDNGLFVDRTPLEITPTGAIKLVYSGGLYGKSARSSSHGIENFDEIVDCLTPNSIDWHLYPSPAAPLQYYHDFVEQAKTLPYLHVHTSVSQQELSTQLATYHFGILPHFKDPDSKVLEAKLRYGTSNKFFNFLEAGIPIIVSDEMTYMAWMVNRYKIGIVIKRTELKDLRQIILKQDYVSLQRNVTRVREILSMKRNVPRLVRFIDSLS